MTWVPAFEITCYLITILLLADMIRRRLTEELYLFLSAAISGYICELLAVRLTGLYHYNPQFLWNIGSVPNQFPVFGGLMWAGITVCSLRIASRLGFCKGMTALFSGWLIVSMDLLMDVCAIRLGGGFWTWEGLAINLSIDHHAFMSVIWTNFFGYLLETPAIVYLTLRRREKPTESIGKKLLHSLAIGLGAVLFVGAGSALTLFLNKLTDDYFAFIAFLILWFAVLAALVRQLIRGGHELSRQGRRDWTLCLYWAAMYGYCLAALTALGILSAVPWYGGLSLFLAAGTVWLSWMTPKREATMPETTPATMAREPSHEDKKKGAIQ